MLGRATFPDADLWSCACAIENLWLAARVEGLGVGWVTLFEQQDLEQLVGVPDGVVTRGWLCLGWPDERPPDPGLERAGWSRRQPVSEVVLAGAGRMPPEMALAALGGPQFCVLAGAVLGAADRGAAVVLDGLATSVAALVAVRLEPAAAAYLVAGQRSRERAHAPVLEYLGFEPLLDLRLRAGEGVGAALATSMLLSGLALRRGIGRTTS